MLKNQVEPPLNFQLRLGHLLSYRIHATATTAPRDLRAPLCSTPAFTAVGVIALGLGIGANTAIFSFVYGLLLRPLAFKDLNHLAPVWETVPDNGDRSGVSPANFFDWERQNDVFERMTLGEHPKPATHDHLKTGHQ